MCTQPGLHTKSTRWHTHIMLPSIIYSRTHINTHTHTIHIRNLTFAKIQLSSAQTHTVTHFLRLTHQQLPTQLGLRKHTHYHPHNKVISATHTHLLYIKSPINTQITVTHSNNLPHLHEIWPRFLLSLSSSTPSLSSPSISSPSSCPPFHLRLNHQLLICLQGEEISLSPSSIFRDGEDLREIHNLKERNSVAAQMQLILRGGA